MSTIETNSISSIDPKSYTLLIVDDEPANLITVTGYLVDRGFQQIKITQTGEDGLELARLVQPNLILLDVRLPGIDGFETCRRLKADEQTRDIPVIFMTVATKTEDKVRGFEVGGVDYITKPFQQDEVFARVTTHLRIRNLTRRLEEVNENLERQVEERTAALTQANQELQIEIAERIRAEAALQDSEERLRLTMEAVNIGSWDWDIKNDIWCASPIYYTMLGYAPKAGPGDRHEWLERVHPDDRAFVENKIQGVLTRDFKEHRYEARLRHADGTYRWQYVYGFGIKRDKEGNVTRMLGIRMDITERKQIEQALLIQEQKYRTLVENIPNLIVRYNTNLHRTYVNPAWEKASGLSTTDVLDVPPVDIPKVPQPIVDEYIAKLRRVLKTGTLQSSEFSWINARGATIFLNYIMVPEYGQDGEIIGVLSVGHDITDRKHAEEEIRQLNQELEQRVLERTAQLEAANKELEAFAYSVSHDLRAPLRHIDGFLELLQQRIDGTLDERSRHYMDTISDSAKRMGQLIDDLLAFSRMGRNKLSKIPVDLDSLIQEIVREFAPEIQGRTVHWRIADLPTINGDRAMLRLALVNLLSNALKFTRERPQVDIEIGCQANGKETIIFVRDNGVGFDMAYADKLFGVFQRLHRAEEFEGTGIGLATVHQIVNRHGGRTWAEGQVNQGATFYFSLPQSIQET